MNLKSVSILLAASLALATNTGAIAGSSTTATDLCNASIDTAISGLEPQPTYRLKGARGGRKRTMTYKLYFNDDQYRFQCIVKRGEEPQIQWPDAVDTAIAAPSQHDRRGEVAGVGN